jgi:hypothetical protein
VSDNDEQVVDEPYHRLPRSPVAEESIVDDVDFPYFTFFLSKMPTYFEYASFFPEIFPILLTRSLSHAAMRHTILSMSAMVLDSAREQPLVRFYGHRQQAISLLQKSLSNDTLDEGVAIAVYLFAWLDFHSGFQEAGFKHLRGLFLIAEHFRKKGSHLHVLIWQMAIRSDFHSAHLSGRAPIFPPLPTNLIYGPPPWTGIFSESQQSKWARAAFILDALWHKTCHMIFNAEQERELDGSLPPFTLFDVEDLEHAHQRWLSLPIVMEANSFEPTIEPAARFLHHDRLCYSNKLYCTLLNHWRGIKIYISLIRSPVIGPGYSSSGRVPIAIDICRTYAAAIQEPNVALWNLVPLNFAAIAFGGANRYPLETKWILERFGECGLTELPTLRYMYEKLWDFWSYQGNYMHAMRFLSIMDTFW